MNETQKTLKDLEKEKLEIEVILLKHDLEKDKNEEKNSKKPGEIIRKNISILLAIISVGGAILGIILPLNKYFDEKKKEQLPVLNKEIIELVKNLNDSTNEVVREDATIMLTYYGLNAIPILLLRLERSKRPTDTGLIINAIKKIHEENPKGVTEKIYYAIEEHFNEDYRKTNIDETSYAKDIYTYYCQLLTSLNLTKKDIKAFEVLLSYIESKIPGSANSMFIDFLARDLNMVCSKQLIDSIKFNEK